MDKQAIGAAVKRFFLRVWDYIKAAKLELIILAAFLAIDLISKAIVEATTYHGQVIVLIPNFLNICNVHNKNAAFGADWLANALGEVGARVVFCILSIAAAIVFAIILVKHRGGHKLMRISLALLIAGALGNCYDRIFIGFVRDFIQFVYFGLTIFGSKTFYVFNIADACLVIGVILMIVFFIFFYRDKDKAEPAAVPEPTVDGQTSDTSTEPKDSSEEQTPDPDEKADEQNAADPQKNAEEENPSEQAADESESEFETDAEDSKTSGAKEEPAEPDGERGGGEK